MKSAGVWSLAPWTVALKLPTRLQCHEKGRKDAKRNGEGDVVVRIPVCPQV
jgi:hypothetical protein